MKINFNYKNWFALTVIFLCALCTRAQQKPNDSKPEDKPELKEAQNFVAEANEELLSNDFAIAESSYRKAIAKDPANLSAKYNMGNNYYMNERYAEGMARYAQAIEVAETKAEKHQAYHNLGNALYKQKDFKKAVEAYKNALRNDPTDDETRYNLALAKEEDEKNGGGDGDDNEDQNEDENEDQNEENKEDEGDEKEDDDGKPKDEGDQGDEGDEGENESDKEQDQDGEPEDKDGDQPQDGAPEEQPQQPQAGKGQLSPQQVQSLLEAMKNEENKVQDKINAKKVKGTPVQTDKDW